MSGDDGRRGRGGRRGAALIVAAALLAGCSSASSVVDNYETTPSPTWSARVTSFFSGAKPGVTQPKSATASAPEVECPGVDIRAGASTLNVATKADQATAGDLRYQLSFGQTARECRVQDGTVFIKVGVQGRAILGPYGAPGAVDVPLRYAIVREGPEPQMIATKFKRAGATIAPGQTHVQFVDIEDGLSFPLPSKEELAAYVIYVGFDEIGDRNEKNEKKPARPGKHSAQR
jgi:hypothetical protein